MKKDYLPISVGLWGIAVPLFVSVFIYCKTLPEKITVALSSLTEKKGDWAIYTLSSTRKLRSEPRLILSHISICSKNAKK